MAGVIPKFENGPVTYEVNAVVRGGRLVEPDGTTGKVKEATANTVKCLGVATKDAKPRGSASSTDEFGNEVTTLVNVTEHVAVGGSNRTYPVTYAANAAFGDLLKAAANGTVTPWVDGTDSPARIVGRCAEKAGVVVATKAVGLAKITV